jgi:hypothetical protein
MNPYRVGPTIFLPKGPNLFIKLNINASAIKSLTLVSLYFIEYTI